MFADGGDIHIAPSKRGTFTAAAKRHGMGVQEFASKVLANKDKYSPVMVKKANFAHNAAGWKHAFGGPMGNMFEGPGTYPNWMNNWNSVYNDYGVGLVPEDVKAAAAARDAAAQATGPTGRAIRTNSPRVSSLPLPTQEELFAMAKTPELDISGNKKNLGNATQDGLLDRVFRNPNWRKPFDETVDLTPYYEDVADEVVDDEPIPGQEQYAQEVRERLNPQFKNSTANSAFKVSNNSF